jgi:hypothetical protein
MTLIEKAFIAGRSQTSWEQFKKDNQYSEIGCNCPADQRHGETEVMCCNECGKPTEEYWIKPQPVTP